MKLICIRYNVHICIYVYINIVYVNTYDIFIYICAKMNIREQVQTHQFLIKKKSQAQVDTTKSMCMCIFMCIYKLV